MEFSSLLNRFSEPETLKMAKLGRALRAEGYDITDLSLGEPDFNTPDHIKQAAKAAVDANYSHYTPVSGYLDLREAVCTKLKRDNGLVFAPEQIVVSTGAKQSIANVVLALVDQGDEVIIPTPYWVTYSALVTLAGGVPVLIKTRIEDGFKLKPEVLADHITPRTKLFMFSSPCNPSGAVYTRDELANLVEVFEQHPQISILSDEIYEYIRFEGEHESIAQFENIKDRTVVINGLSKGYAMTGWRVGYMAGPLELAKACDKLQGQFTSATNSIAQRAAIEALLGDMKPTQDMVTAFHTRRTHILNGLQQIPNLRCHEPAGAFYVFPDVSAYFGKCTSDGTIISDSNALCMYLLNSAHVSTVTGSAFGEPNCIRLSFANSLENIEKGIGRIREAMALLH
jgi:aspartate aminotransferase